MIYSGSKIQVSNTIRGEETMRALLIMVSCVLFTAEASASEYVLGVDSLPQDGVPKGEVLERTWGGSRIYPNTTTDYWVYVPDQYREAEPACVMVFQDGADYVDSDGLVRAPTVFDNLIHKGEMPVTIGIFINPGKKERAYDQRAIQYVPLDDTYARFLLEEILPEVNKDYNLVSDASGRAIAGMSDGGLVSFTVAWERPDAFSKVISHIGSYTRLRGGSEYPYLIRETRGNPKPIRVFLQDGENDLNLWAGNWTLANLSMESALMFARYDYRFEMGTGGHSLRHGGAIFPDTLRWIWRDYPGVTTQPGDPGEVAGVWDVVTNVHGFSQRSELTIAAQNGVLGAMLVDDKGKEIDVTAISFEDGILSYEYEARIESKEGDQYKEADRPLNGPRGGMVTWLKVRGDTFRGAVSDERTSTRPKSKGKGQGKGKAKADHSVKGNRRSTAPQAN
jgi:enterochelin esterase-like enzyme